MTLPKRIPALVTAALFLLVTALFLSPLFTDFAFADNKAPDVSSAMSMPAPDTRNMPENAIWTKCTPLNVAVFAKRVHVKCAETVGGVQWFAAPTADATHAARVLSVLSTAQAVGKTLDIFYDPTDLNGAAVGCATSDCRLIEGVAFLK